MDPARYAVCQSVLRGENVRAQLEQAVDAGIAGVGITASSIDELGLDKLVSTMDELGLATTSIMTCPDGAPFERAAMLIDAAAALGAPGVLVAVVPAEGTGAEADDRFRRWLEPAAERAASVGVRMMVEPIHPMLKTYTRVHSLRHALSLIADLPGTGLVVDTAHLYWDRFLFDDMAANIELISTVQLSDIPNEAIAEFRFDRGPLGKGALPLTPMVAATEAAGYRGWYENEVLMRIPSAERVGFLRADREWFEAL